MYQMKTARIIITCYIFIKIWRSLNSQNKYFLNPNIYTNIYYVDSSAVPVTISVKMVVVIKSYTAAIFIQGIV